jgi:SAM-dependent methyltransferase
MADEAQLVLETRADRQETCFVNLHRMASARKFNAWMAECIRPYLGKRVLEVGAGTGNLTHFLLDAELLVATDIAPEAVQLLEKTFAGTGIKVEEFDLTREPGPAWNERAVDTIVCFNVLEHIGDDISALLRLRRILAPGGHLVILVPAFSFLYTEYDRSLGHFRRYTATGLKEKLSRCGFHVADLYHFNLAGVLGWLVNFKILKRQGIPETQLRIFDWFVPLFRAEKYLRLPIGLSLVAVARKPPAQIAD